MGMTSNQIRQLKAKKRVDQAIEERLAGLLTSGAAANAEESAGNGDGGDDTALHQNPQEGHDGNPAEGGQASSNLGSVNSPLESQAQPGGVGESPEPVIKEEPEE